MTFLKRIALLILTIVTLPLMGAPSGAQSPQTPVLNLEAKIFLGEVKGRIDHMAFDPLRGRLFVAELGNNSLGIVDIKEHKVVHVIMGLSEPQGVGYEPSSDTLYVANGGDGSVRLFGGTDYAETGRIDLGDDADNVRIDTGTKRVLVGYGSGAIAAIDPVKRAKVASFPLPAHPEGFQLAHKTSQIFVNVPRSKAIVTLDSVSGQRKATWPMMDAGANFPMALDEDAQQVVVAFRSPPKLGVFSARSGERVASVDLCGDSDDVFVDAKRALIYASCGEGSLEVFATRDGNYRRLVRLPTSPGARTSYYDASIDRLFLAVRATSAEPAAIWVYRPTP